MHILKTILKTLTPKERLVFLVSLIVFGAALFGKGALAVYQNSEYVPIAGGNYKEGMVGQPMALNPVVSGLNQADLDISALIYSTLQEIAANLEIKENGRVYAVQISDSILWDDGVRLTSDDVLFTIQTLKAPEVNSHLAKSWQGVEVERVSEIQLIFRLPSPYVFFENNLGMLPVIPKHIFGNIPPANIRLSDYNFEPVGSGPYRFAGLTRRKDGFITSVELTRNELYHGEKPYVKDFHFHFYENEDALISDFVLRKIHGFGTTNPITLEDRVLKIATVREIPMRRTYAIFFNRNINPVLREKEFRSALAAAIPKNLIISEALGGKGTILSGPLESGFATDETSIHAARETVSRVKEKFDTSLTLLTPGIEFLEKTATIVKNSWLELGLENVQVIPLETDLMLNEVIRTRNYEAVLFGNIYPNPQDLFPFWHSSQRFYPGLNLALYENVEVDKILEEIRQTHSDEERMAKLQRAESLIMEDSPAIFLFSLPYTYVHTDHLKGFVSNEIVLPKDRFEKVQTWYVKQARVITEQ